MPKGGNWGSAWGKNMMLDLRTPARARKSRLVTLLVAAMAFVLATPQMAFAAFTATAENTANVQGIVYSAVHLDTGATVVGGDFAGVGTHSTRNVGILKPDGSPETGFKVTTDGIVYAVAAKADGSVVYLGGTFTQVNNQPRAGLAAVDAKGNLLGWRADTDGAVRAMEMVGTTLYVGGSFRNVGAVTQGRLVSFDTATSTGNGLTGFAPKPDWTVRDIAWTPGKPGMIYISGGFNNVGGQPRDSAAEIDITSGAVTKFSPDTNTDTGLAIDVTPNGGRLFFSSPNNEVYAFDLATGKRVWTTKGGGDTQAIDSTNDEVFIGGHFRNITTWKVKRNMVASLNVTDGTVTGWDPHISGDMGPWAIQATDEKLVVGGDFGWVNRKTRAGIARFPVG